MPRTLAALLVLLCVPFSSALAADVVRLGNLKFAHYGAIAYMKEIAPQYGLEIQERVFPKGIDIIPAIIAGEIDAAASAADGAVAARATGVPVLVVAGFAKGGARIVGRGDMKWSSVADLKGKKVGVARGGAQELVLLAELDKHGLSFSDKGDKDVHLVYMAYADINQALLSRNIDAMCQSEPQSSQALSQGFGVEIIKPYDTPLGEPVRTLVITEKLYANKDVAERFLKCFVAATKFFIDNPDKAQAYVREKMFKGQLSDEDYRQALENSPFSYDVTADHVQTTIDMMVKYGIGKLANPPKAADFVKLDLLAKARKDLGIQ
ncbi:Putative aliphatic sulfonates-binding protein [Fundidesulfovibrio magnetotacticus]|uniref:Aliphatic sulfonates-binding protein n=1 Tax=Fundidesulfovibrio magnetotacticus TaxID=2730080 RepID=A0A6V8LXS9_9BACT|nr:ABC transporter substrate-binding protein [Fundidesulfovibrio magnetotacticus]GFK95391.1 Putative aliphatic sulfonates-binding protein [Fundidesulfovibrio magnetotacticus]